jgi:hypothetical protein
MAMGCNAISMNWRGIASCRRQIYEVVMTSRAEQKATSDSQQQALDLEEKQSRLPPLFLFACICMW